jgi:lipoprotein-anchoring transpeptidase ErfK/SrfK
MIRRFLILTFTFCFLTSCAPAPNNPTTANVNTAPSPPTAPSPAAESRESSAQITLPLLNALLADENFVNDLRSRLKLTNEQVDSLKRVSNEEIARLQEANAEELDGSSGDAREHASEQLNKILGDQKAKELTSFANEYWSKSDASEATASGPTMLPGPNAVPTDTRVVVNIPAFRMDLFQDGSLVKSYRVGIGYPQFPLPQGLRKASSIIFNPTWTPPDEPWVAKMKNITPGETVEAGSKLNPLGPIKIPIGLPSLIHGGKPPAKIGKFASHGCVGLTNNQIKDFALLLSKASGTELSDTTLASYLQEKEETKTVKLKETIPVELRYETIVLEDGKLHIYKDVYKQNTNLEENLRKVLEVHGARLEDLSEQQRAEINDALTGKTKPKKGETGVVIDLTALSGKGYPAPVNLDNGSGKPGTRKSTKNTNH